MNKTKNWIGALNEKERLELALFFADTESLFLPDEQIDLNHKHQRSSCSHIRNLAKNSNKRKAKNRNKRKRVKQQKNKRK